MNVKYLFLSLVFYRKTVILGKFHNDNLVSGGYATIASVCLVNGILKPTFKTWGEEVVVRDVSTRVCISRSPLSSDPWESSQV